MTVLKAIKALLEGIVAAAVAMVAIPAGMAYGIFILPFLRASEAWGKRDYSGAAIYAVLGGAPAWVILGIILFSK